MQKKENDLIIIEKDFEDNVFTLIHLAKKARKVSMGFGAVQSSIIRGSTKLLLIAKDISEITLKKIMKDDSVIQIDKLIFSDKRNIAKEL
ncbi:MAG: ribosomal L7Ae/L30e/S12e/Gadd45 family protein, partial [Candidatus Cloacimonadota bacterium]|nr:ribosomal L7Ae/L30e/S12e/Gadd45 family protein [Candidatus Cloacimonadota bacterium]